MKWFIIGGAMLMLSLWFMLFQNDNDRHLLESEHLKFTAQEAAAAAAQYFVEEDYAEGSYVFNQAEGIEAAEYIIKNNLELENDFEPQKSSYWTKKVTYNIEFFDDETITHTASCTQFPCLYVHETTDFALALTVPTIIITIYAGEARYTLFEKPPEVYRTGAHEWVDYNQS